MRSLYCPSFFAALFFCCSTSLFAQYLWVQDPQTTWRWGQGTIEEATLVVRPKGIYVENHLYLVISSANSGYTSSRDQLEIRTNFTLPLDAIVTDSWLWVGDDIIQAKIMDRWTATSIYESIVQRRRDPSILTKVGPRNYELNIYPLMGNQTRKIKLTYLTTTQWSAESVLAQLPVQLLNLSARAVPLTLIYWPNQIWKTPGIEEAPTLKFNPGYDSVSGSDFLVAKIPADVVRRQNNLTLRFASPLNNGVYLNHYNNGTDGFYQIVFMPSQALDISVSKKVAVLFDYDPTKSSLSLSDVVTNVKRQMRNYFSKRDSFNLIFSQLAIRRYSSGWVGADSLSVEQAFSAIGTSTIAMYSNLPSLLANAVDFIKNTGKDGSLLLVSNSDQVGNSVVANLLINDLKTLSPTLPPIHIADYTSQNYSSYFINGTYFYGNEYFYSNLAKISSGSYSNVRTGLTFTNTLIQRFEALNGIMTVFDFYSGMKNGFCYARYTLSAPVQAMSTPVIQVGKYQGSVPFTIQASGLFQSKPFSKTVELGLSEIFFGDTVNTSIWSGNYIRSLETTQPSNSTSREIIENSIRYRVLSTHTAFLALEPNDTVKPCFGCRDESKLGNQTSVGNTTLADSLRLSAAPNPFSAETTIRIALPTGIQPALVNIELFNILGQKIRDFAPVSTGSISDKILTFVWPGDDDSGEKVRAGIYLLSVSTPNGRVLLKIQKTD